MAPLMAILLNNPTPVVEASFSLQHSFYTTSFSTSTPITTYLLFLCSQNPAVSLSTIQPLLPPRKRKAEARFRLFLWRFIFPADFCLQWFVNYRILFAQILSFLAFENKRFCARDFCRLSRDVMNGDGVNDFWVKRTARHLLDSVSDSNHEDWILGTI